MPHSYQVDQSISVLRVVWWFFSSNFNRKLCILTMNTHIIRPSRSATSDLGLHSLSVSHKKTLGLHVYGLIMIILVITHVTVYDKNEHFKQAFTCNMF